MGCDTSEGRDHAQDDCGCCEGITRATPQAIENRPGLDAVAYRVGTHAQLKQSMVSALSEQSDPVKAALSGLRTRDDADPSLALLDAWAVVGDVLTFYQERIANESYLRTAQERVSVLELARSIGYELRPAVAAEVDLAFSLESAPGAPEQVTLPIGTRVQSLPGPGEVPQVFETVEALEARPEWNQLRPRLTRAQTIEMDTKEVWLQGVATGLKRGDALLFVGAEREKDKTSDRWDMRRVLDVRPEREVQQTFVRLDHGLGSWWPKSLPAAKPRVFALRLRAALFGHNAPDWRTMPVCIQANYLGKAEMQVQNDPALRSGEWRDFSLRGIEALAPGDLLDVVHLDGEHPEVLPGSWVVLSTPTYSELFRVKAAEPDAKQGFALTRKTTRLTLTGENLEKRFNTALRETVVLAQSEELTLAETPISEPVEGDAVELDGVAPELPPGRKVILSGFDENGVPAAEVAVIASGPQPLAPLEEPAAGDRATVSAPVKALLSELRFREEKKVTLELRDTRIVKVHRKMGSLLAYQAQNEIHFASALQHRYRRQDLIIWANVAHATHGESVTEVLGGGNATQAFQRFALRQVPLTYRSAASPTPLESSLTVQVGPTGSQVRWHEVQTLFSLPELGPQGPREHAYITRMDDEGTTTVIFGDGRTSARLPGGNENVTAVYRKGAGREGNVGAGTLSLLLTHPLGVNAVTNPIMAWGGVDRQTRDEARENAPLTVLTMDRVVSLQDYEDFARSYPGIAKALASRMWQGERVGVFLTLAGPEGEPVGDELQTRLLLAIAAAGVPSVPVQVRSYEKVTFSLTAHIQVHPERELAQVLNAVAEALRARFSFSARAFGQAVASSEIQETIHGVPGVVMVDVKELAVDRPEEGGLTFHRKKIVAKAARRKGSRTQPLGAAELLVWDESMAGITGERA